MIPRSPHETLDSPRVTLHKLEQNTDSGSDGQDVAELKQILLNRIAELETLNALSPRESEPVLSSAPSELPPLPVVGKEEGMNEALEAVPLQKLD